MIGVLVLNPSVGAHGGNKNSTFLQHQSWGSCPKMHNLKQIMRKHQPNSNWQTFHRICGLYFSREEAHESKRLRKCPRSGKVMAAQQLISVWVPGLDCGPAGGHQKDNQQNLNEDSNLYCINVTFYFLIFIYLFIF